MAQAKITKREVDALRNEATRKGQGLYLWDTELGGFGCRASASGSVSWLVQKWIGGRGGKAKRITIGKMPSMSLEDARTQASIIIGDVHKGIDVVDRRAKLRKEQRETIAAPELGVTINAYLEKKRQSGRYWAEVEQILNREIIPQLGKNTKVASITKAQIRKILEDKEKAAPGAVRNLFATLRPFFKWCVECDIISVSPMASLPVPSPSEKRDRYLCKDEIKAYWNAATIMDYPFGFMFKLVLLTGQRRDEVSDMTWNELDLETKTWIIPGHRAKNNKEHIVHLSEQSIAIFCSIPKQESEYVFTTTLKTPISGFSKAKACLNSLMKKELKDKFRDFWLHDNRRTITTTLAELGIPEPVCDRILNHVSNTQSGVKGVYQKFQYLEERKRALETWGNHVDRLITNTAKETSNVIQLRA